MRPFLKKITYGCTSSWPLATAAGCHRPLSWSAASIALVVLRVNVMRVVRDEDGRPPGKYRDQPGPLWGELVLDRVPSWTLTMSPRSNCAALRAFPLHWSGERVRYGACACACACAYSRRTGMS
jgi:hypothetical protein